MTLALDKPTKPRVKRWTKREYNELVDLGAFRGQRVYLFRGELIEMPSMGYPHAQAVTNVTRVLFELFGPSYAIRIQLPFETPGESMPEPDAAVCTEAQSKASRPHPTRALLVIEVSDTSVDEDREKALEYAAAGIPEYWLIDVNTRTVTVYREPAPDSSTALGFRYASVTTLVETDVLAPQATPAASVVVSKLLP